MTDFGLLYNLNGQLTPSNTRYYFIDKGKVAALKAASDQHKKGVLTTAEVRSWTYPSSWSPV